MERSGTRPLEMSASVSAYGRAHDRAVDDEPRHALRYHGAAASMGARSGRDLHPLELCLAFLFQLAPVARVGFAAPDLCRRPLSDSSQWV